MFTKFFKCDVAHHGNELHISAKFHGLTNFVIELCLCNNKKSKKMMKNSYFYLTLFPSIQLAECLVRGVF